MWTDFVWFVTHAPLWFKIVGFAIIWWKVVGITCGVIGLLFGVLNLLLWGTAGIGDPPWWQRFLVLGLIVAVGGYIVCLFWSAITACLIIAVVLGVIANFFRSPDNVAYERMLEGKPPY